MPGVEVNVSGATRLRIAQFPRGGDVPVRGVIVLHRAGVLANLLAADEVGAVHLVVMADPSLECRRPRCCSHQVAQLFYRLVRLGRPKHSNARRLSFRLRRARASAAPTSHPQVTCGPCPQAVSLASTGSAQSPCLRTDVLLPGRRRPLIPASAPGACSQTGSTSRACPRTAWALRAPPASVIFGHLIDGTQAELVRVPFAETSVYKLPVTVTPEQGTLLSDILPTGYEIGIQYGMSKPATWLPSSAPGPSAWPRSRRRACTVRVGSSRSTWMPTGSTRRRNSAPPSRCQRPPGTGCERVLDLTDGARHDVPIEAVIPATFPLPQSSRLHAGTCHLRGHGHPVELAFQDLWIKDIAITTGLVSATTTPMLLEAGRTAQVEPGLCE